MTCFSGDEKSNNGGNEIARKASVAVLKECLYCIVFINVLELRITNSGGQER